MKTVFRADARKLPDGMQVSVGSRSFSLVLDEPTDMGGTDAGMNPVEALLCALGACQCIVAAAFAPARGIGLRGISVALEGDLDPDGFRGVPGVRRGYTEIRSSVVLDADLAPEKAAEFADFIEETCPVADCLVNGVRLVRTGVTVGKTE